MNRHQVIVVGGGIGGSAAALRAAQHGLTVAWIRGDAGTARASRARYVFNVDNMSGVSGGIVQRKALQLLSGPEHAAAREALARTHFHVGIPEIVEDVTLRLTADFAVKLTTRSGKVVDDIRWNLSLGQRRVPPLLHPLRGAPGARDAGRGVRGERGRGAGRAPRARALRRDRHAARERGSSARGP